MRRFATISLCGGRLTRFIPLTPLICILLLLFILTEVTHAQPAAVVQHTQVALKAHKVQQQQLAQHMQVTRKTPEAQNSQVAQHMQVAQNSQVAQHTPEAQHTHEAKQALAAQPFHPSQQDTLTEPSAADPEYIRIETKNGSLFFGVLISEDEQTVTISIEGVGEITIQRAVIKTIERLSKDRFRDGTYWFENPQATRYFFAPNALSLEKKQGYYQNIWILFNNVNYGLTERFSIGVGMIPFFLFGAESSPIWILPKVTFPIQDGQFHVGAGAMLGGLIGEETESLGLLYGVGTYGDRDRNATLGIGYGYAGEELSTSPFINLSGMWRIGPRVTLLTENYFIPEADMAGLISIGARRTYERFAVDFGLVKPLGEDTDENTAIPWLGVTMPFGRP